MKTTRATIGGLLFASLLLGACGAGGAAAPSEPVTLPPDAPVTSPPDGGGGVVPSPPFVVPVPGQQDLRPVAITSLTPTVDGRHVTVQADWTSGIEPCNVLDSVEVTQEGSTFTIELFEGTGDPNAICIEIAVSKSTIVDLGELPPGQYIVESAGGTAAPASFTVE